MAAKCVVVESGLKPRQGYHQEVAHETCHISRPVQNAQLDVAECLPANTEVARWLLCHYRIVAWLTHCMDTLCVRYVLLHEWCAHLQAEAPGVAVRTLVGGVLLTVSTVAVVYLGHLAHDRAVKHQ